MPDHDAMRVAQHGPRHIAQCRVSLGSHHGTSAAVDPFMHALVRAAGAATLVLSSRVALAQDHAPSAPAGEPPPEPTTASALPPSEPAASEPDVASVDSTYRDHGLRLGLDLAFQRSLGGGDSRANLNTPSLIPLGADLSLRTSSSFLIGLHGFLALASRDDCTDADSCRARAYGFGAHIEGTPIRDEKYSGWIRYGMGYELVYHGGMPFDASGHEFRGAWDIIDLRVGADFVIHRGSGKKAARIGPFLGAVVGLLTTDSGVVTYNNNAKELEGGNKGSVNGWFQIGMRGTLDP